MVIELSKVFDTGVGVLTDWEDDRLYMGVDEEGNDVLFARDDDGMPCLVLDAKEVYELLKRRYEQEREDGREN